MMFLSIIVLALKTNIQTLTIYTVLNTIALPLFTVPLNSAAFNVIEKNQHNTYRVEYIILQEIGLNAGRLLGTLIFIMLADMLEKPKITLAFLLFIGSVQLWTLLFRKKIDFDVNFIVIKGNFGRCLMIYRWDVSARPHNRQYSVKFCTHLFFAFRHDHLIISAHHEEIRILPANT